MRYSMLAAVIFIIGIVNANGSDNLLTNGAFSQPDLLDQQNYANLNFITGWTSSGQFQLFQSNIQNVYWPTTTIQVIQIANPQTQTIWQNFASDYDYYNLYFQYAGHPWYSLTLAQAYVYFNGALIMHLLVNDYSIQNITIQLTSNSTSNQIKFQPLGISLQQGIGIANVQMIGFCNLNRTYSLVDQKCMWNAIPNCLIIDEASGNCTQFQQTQPNLPNQPILNPQSNVSKCLPGFYFSEQNCKPCLLPCNQCQGSPRNCLSCPSFYHFSQQNQCVIQSNFLFLIALAISLPGFESTSFGFIFIGNLDQFWPYYSHHREYGHQTSQTLQLIHTLQNNKWFLNSFEKKIDFNFQHLNFSDFSRYSNRKFMEQENRTSYFWDGAFQILFYCFPVSLIVFFALRKLFYLTLKYRVSRNFRLYSFYLTIYVMSFEGDVSYLSFISFNNAMNLFSFKFQDKLGHILWAFVFFFLIFFCMGSFFIAKILYKNLSKYFIEDFFPFVESIYVMSFLCTKALVMGATNALLATNYETLIISLLSIELICITVIIYFQLKFRCFKLQTFMYTLILKSIIMAIFNTFVLIDWKMRTSKHGQTDQQTTNLFDLICKVLIIIVFGLGSIQIISAYFSGRKMIRAYKKTQETVINYGETRLEEYAKQKKPLMYFVKIKKQKIINIQSKKEIDKQSSKKIQKIKITQHQKASYKPRNNTKINQEIFKNKTTNQQILIIYRQVDCQNLQIINL